MVIHWMSLGGGAMRYHRREANTKIQSDAALSSKAQATPRDEFLRVGKFYGTQAIWIANDALLVVVIGSIHPWPEPVSSSPSQCTQTIRPHRFYNVFFCSMQSGDLSIRAIYSPPVFQTRASSRPLKPFPADFVLETR